EVYSHFEHTPCFNALFVLNSDIHSSCLQSSALGFLLAQKHFTNPLVAVPSAVSVVCMALGGSALAVFWRNRGLPADDKDDFKE
uniref:Uncharacterized protein n=1 Tax=Aegilops tauschii subsp. strangulata TaxID=200361 RepID=A0A453F4J9_AEGTS